MSGSLEPTDGAIVGLTIEARMWENIIAAFAQIEGAKEITEDTRLFNVLVGFRGEGFEESSQITNARMLRANVRALAVSTLTCSRGIVSGRRNPTPGALSQQTILIYAQGISI